MNVTPDSFYDGGKTIVLRDIIAQAEKMVSQGAFFLDVGGYSSRPGAVAVSESEELERVVPVIKALRKEFPDTYLSIDTFRSTVARAAVDSGTDMVNDISGGQLDPQMLSTVGELQVPYVLMHMKGTPQTMTDKATYENVVQEMIYYFSERLAMARKEGINDVIIDPGFGFAKTVAHNFETLNHLELFQNISCPLLVGISRKSTIYKTLGITAEEALNGTSVLHTYALSKGAAILRVHDVKEAKECVTLLQAITNTN